MASAEREPIMGTEGCVPAGFTGKAADQEVEYKSFIKLKAFYSSIVQSTIKFLRYVVCKLLIDDMHAS